MEEAAARRERLKALKAAKQLVEADADGDAGQPSTAEAAEPEKPVLKFRNYAVKDEQHIQHEKVRCCSSSRTQRSSMHLPDFHSFLKPGWSECSFTCMVYYPYCRWRQHSRRSLQQTQS